MRGADEAVAELTRWPMPRLRAARLGGIVCGCVSLARAESAILRADHSLDAAGERAQW